jgi:hypothetical protein
MKLLLLLLLLLLSLFVSLYALMCFPPVFNFKESSTLSCVCPVCNYFYLHCAVPVIGLVAIGSAHK